MRSVVSHPCSSCTMRIAAMHADCFCSAGYLAVQRSIRARISGDSRSDLRCLTAVIGPPLQTQNLAYQKSPPQQPACGRGTSRPTLQYARNQTHKTTNKKTKKHQPKKKTHQKRPG